MSTRELLYTMIDGLTEQQMQGLIMLLSGKENKSDPKSYRDEVYSVMGGLSEYANPDLIPLEKDAWEMEVKAKYENNGR